MSKWNLFEIFSHIDITKHKLPNIRKTARLSGRNVRFRVMDQLDMEPNTEPEGAAHRCWRFGRIPAIVTAAALLVSGSAITAAAASGGFQELFQIAFGKDTEYPETLEELYAVPDAEIIDTCDAIDCRVAGVFGDSRSVTVVLEFTGENGFTLPENVLFTNGFGSVQPLHMEDVGWHWGGSLKTSRIYDPSDGGHIYMVQQMLFDDEVQQGKWQFHFDSGVFMKSDASVETWQYWFDKKYNMRDIRNWLGFTGAEINQRKNLSAEDEQRVWEAFTCINEDEINTPEDRQFVLKEDVLTEGSITIDFPLEYPTSEPLTDTFTYVDEKTSEETEMEMTLTPWCATFVWDLDEPMPSFINQYVGPNVVELNYDAMGHCKLLDGTVTAPYEFSVYASVSGGSVYRSGSEVETTLPEPSRKCNFTITFSQPVDPSQVAEIYYLKDGLIWTKK